MNGRMKMLRFSESLSDYTKNTRGLVGTTVCVCAHTCVCPRESTRETSLVSPTGYDAAYNQWTEANRSRGVGGMMGEAAAGYQADKQLPLPLCPPLSAGQKADGTGGNGVVAAVEDTGIYTCRSVSFQEIFRTKTPNFEHIQYPSLFIIGCQCIHVI